MKNLAVIGLLLLLTTGCSSLKLKDFNKIEVGMSKAQVIDQLGDPSTTKAIDGREILEYAAKDENGDQKPRWVVMQDREVIFYGRPSEYQAQVEKQNKNEQINPHIQTTISPVFSPVFNNGVAPQSSAPSDTKLNHVPQDVTQASVSPKGESIKWFHPAPGEVQQ